MAVMEKYRGPEKQYPKVEKKYLIRLLIGLIIITGGVLSVNVNVALSRSTVMVPGADPGAGPEEISSGIEISTVLPTLFFITGSFVNVWAIYRYRDDYAEIKETEPRPEMLFVLAGLVATIIAFAIGFYIAF
ncbi:MAG: hypothetical protein CMO11_00810 [Thaumarchaeota archaeon]|nr:hypothetical protein [Nitrososphaerota archaeon]